MTFATDYLLVRLTVRLMRTFGIGTLERDVFSSSHHPALGFLLRVFFSENRCPLFGITR